ncbi:MAG: sulfite exporter TauE/SafE family protein [Proteobacteria bacterium]|nr:sulfite exporter TauE/SafE family protein [Pseudomonadota bacterium]
MNPLQELFVALGIFSIGFCVSWVITARRREREKGLPNGVQLIIGAVTNFFDALGIGSFAPTTSAFKLTKTVADEEIPGTLNIGHAIPTFLSAFIYMQAVDVDPVTLVALIGASVVGAWFGAGIVSSWPRRNVQLGMGLALLVAACLFTMKQLKMFPAGGTAIALSGSTLAIGFIGNVALGALMTLGIGLYAPCMIMVALLGMDPKAAFPIMMGSCAFLQAVGSVPFMTSDRYNLRAALGLTIGGVPGVLVATYIVKELSVDQVRVGVIFIVLYTAVSMLMSAMRERGQGGAASEALVPDDSLVV